MTDLTIEKLEQFLATPHQPGSVIPLPRQVASQLFAAMQENQRLRAALLKAKYDLLSTCILVGYSNGEDGVNELMHYVNQVEEVVVPAMKAIDELLHPNEVPGDN